MARVDDSLSLENSYSIIQRNVLSLTTSAPQQQYVSICGRKSETHTLLKVYQRLLETKQAQTVVIHGESGSGKTALANTLRSPVFKTGGYFVEGKYHQRNVTVQEPYSAIMVALSSLCDILVRCVDFDESKRRELKKALGSDATLLVKFISNLQPLIGEFQDIETEPISFAKFKVACKLFFRAVASMGHPIVMFLDDIQWMDEESTRLIRVFLQDKKLTNVIFVLAYRDEDAVQVFETGVLDYIRYQANIAVPNLDTATVAEIVSSNLGSTPCDQMRRLIDLAVNVTFNNPLRLTLFLETIQEEELLIYDNEEQAWIFNFDEIFQRAMASESTSELLKRKVNQLSEDLKDILKVASLLGHHFGEAVLLPVACTVIEKRRLLVSNAGLAMPGGTPSHSSVLMLLTDAVGEGLLMNTSQGFTFTHDEVQSACRSLYTASEKSSLHQLIGDAFLAQQKDDQLSIFRAAVHMNCVPASFLHGNDQQQRAKIARLNLEAAKYCETICAFDKTIIMLRTGLDILRPSEKWSAGNFTLTFEMMEALARTELMVGNFEACNQTTTEALSRGETALMNANLLLIQAEVQMLMGGHEVDKTLATATRTLRVFGVKVPRKPWFHLFVAKRLKVKYMLRGKTDEDLLSLPCADDPLAAYAVKLLMHVCTYCLMKGETSAAIFYALLALELTLKKGLSQQSPCGFVLYGIVEASLGNIDQGYRFGKLACRMLDRIDSRATECPTVTYACTMLLFRKEEFHALVAPLYEAATSGLQYGRSFRYNEYALAGSYRMHFQMDTHLESIEDSMRLWYGNVSDLGQDEQLMWIQPIFQYILNMRADVDSWGDISILTGEIMNEEEFFRQATNTNDELHKLMGLFWKIKLAIDFGQVSLAASIMENLKSYDVKGMRILSMGPSYFFDRARVSYGLFRLWGQRRHLREARKDRRELQRMNNAGCPSALPLLSFLAAREDTLRKNYVDVSTQRAAYKRGIDFLVESKSYSLEGLLNENAGFDFARRGLRADAEHYFDRALYIYQTKYGAIAKYNQLRQSSAKALARLQDSAAAKSPDVTRMAGDTGSHISTMNS